MRTKIVLIDSKECLFDWEGFKLEKLNGDKNGYSRVAYHSDVRSHFNKSTPNFVFITSGHVYVLNYNAETYKAEPRYANYEAWHTWKYGEAPKNMPSKEPFIVKDRF